MSSGPAKIDVTGKRRRWMATLAKAPWPAIDAAWSEWNGKPTFVSLRPVETGLVMVRARAGGSGAPFNFGEATVTRCSVLCETGHTGHAYILGRNHAHARAAAEIDAVLQDEKRHGAILREIVLPLQNIIDKKSTAERSKTAATRVEFFTLVRGED